MSSSSNWRNSRFNIYHLMKKVLLFFVMSVLVTSANAKPMVVLTPAQQLIERLTKIQQKGYMYGHQDDPFYGITWEWDYDRSDTKELVGDYPAVMGFEIGGIEKDDAKNLDSVPFTRMREEIQNHYRRGGIITISWHPRNPLLGTTAWIQNDTTAYNKAVEALKAMGQDCLAAKVPNPKHTCKSILPGGCEYEKFQLWLHRVADFLVSLKDDNGNQIPFIFRPWHENNGSWFWWGQNLCSTEEFLGLWNMTQDFVNNVQVGNATLKDYLVWSFSPNLQGYWTEEAWMERYPGDERIDLIGVDAYQWGTEDDFRNGLNADLKLVTKICREHGKLLALTECGYINTPDATWWQRVLKPIIEAYPICYFLPWRNYKKEYFGATKDGKTAEDFKAWSKDKKFLFAGDIKKIK